MVELTEGQAEFGVLGPLQVIVNGQLRPIGGPKPRLVLAMLLMNAGRPVSTERLIVGLWEEGPPAGAVNTVQAHVSHLRRALRGTGAVLMTQAPGYLLRVERTHFDLLRFEDLVSAARAAVDGEEAAAARAQEAAVGRLDQALALWRGTPLDDLGPGEFADNARAFLQERRLGVVEDRVDLLLALRRYREAAENCESVLVTHPLREAVWEKLLLALYRSGRQADALARYRDCRDILIGELGVEPMPQLRRLEQQILNHDPVLDPGPRSATVAPTGARSATGTTTVLHARLQADLVVDGDEVVALAGRMIVGRHPSCDVVLSDDGAVSRRHAEIRFAGGRHMLLDLSSSNGTWVAGRPVLQHLLEDGDVFEVGSHQLLYRTH
jgi:DNA-binding SARP family transcriptional activator